MSKIDIINRIFQIVELIHYCQDDENFIKEVVSETE